jgi:hypothetical protein
MIWTARLVALAGWCGLMVAAGDTLDWGRGYGVFLLFAHSAAAFAFGLCVVLDPRAKLERVSDADDWPPSIRLDDVHKPRKPRIYSEGFESWDK